MDIKSNTIVRGNTTSNIESHNESRRALVTRSNSLRKADSPPTLRPNRMPPPLPEHEVVDNSHTLSMQMMGQTPQMGSMPVPPLVSQQQAHPHPPHPHHMHHNHNHSVPHLNHQNFNQFRNNSQPSMPPMQSQLMVGPNPSPVQTAMKQQLSLNLNQNQNFKNGFNSNTSSVNNISPNNNNNNTIWTNRAKFSVLPQPQQPVIPQHPFPPNPSQHHFAPQSLPQSHPQQQMKQQLGPQHPTTTSQQRAKSPVHSMPQLMAHHNHNQNQQINEQTIPNGPQMPYQTSQQMMSSMPIQNQSHLVPTQPTGQPISNSQNAYPYPHPNVGQLHIQHSVAMNAPTSGQPTRGPSPQQPSPKMMAPPSHGPQQAMPSPTQHNLPPQQSQQRLSHEQFRAALQLVVSPGDPRFESLVILLLKIF